MAALLLRFSPQFFFLSWRFVWLCHSRLVTFFFITLYHWPSICFSSAWLALHRAGHKLFFFWVVGKQRLLFLSIFDAEVLLAAIGPPPLRIIAFALCPGEPPLSPISLKMSFGSTNRIWLVWERTRAPAPIVFKLGRKWDRVRFVISLLVLSVDQTLCCSCYSRGIIQSLAAERKRKQREYVCLARVSRTRQLVVCNRDLFLCLCTNVTHAVCITYTQLGHQPSR